MNYEARKMKDYTTKRKGVKYRDIFFLGLFIASYFGMIGEMIHFLDKDPPHVVILVAMIVIGVISSIHFIASFWRRGMYQRGD